jgi:excisionase family DNA binding protein
MPGDDRRDPDRQRPAVTGRRRTDPTLTTRDCANRLGVSPNFIIGEIRDGRLKAIVLQRAGRRTLYRIAPTALDDYLARHGWTFSKTGSS